jgi:hypothetical protein
MVWSRTSQQITPGRESAKKPSISVFCEIEALHEESRDCQTASAGCRTSAAQSRRLAHFSDNRYAVLILDCQQHIAAVKYWNKIIRQLKEEANPLTKVG